ncbi:Holliday junction DNA helicase ruvB [Vibrio ishigakensis]|uniref:Holliday junction DNA helicase ruvB n=1 Tax=Vibrio ishigakensis TaxID=1481914 RepID=A0A0B8P987_9VIBR|nr:Holliday junction DNA helicase ruvB [Vibrio ishigakensis]
MIEADRLIAADNPTFKDEEAIDRAIRPKKLADYQGQDHVRGQMEIFIKAAQLRNEP